MPWALEASLQECYPVRIFHRFLKHCFIFSSALLDQNILVLNLCLEQAHLFSTPCHHLSARPALATRTCWASLLLDDALVPTALAGYGCDVVVLQILVYRLSFTAVSAMNFLVAHHCSGPFSFLFDFASVWIALQFLSTTAFLGEPWWIDCKLQIAAVKPCWLKASFHLDWAASRCTEKVSDQATFSDLFESTAILNYANPIVAS